MTGQVKEDILSRAGELGITVKNGRLAFNPVLVRRLAFLSAAREFVFIPFREREGKYRSPEIHCSSPAVLFRCFIVLRKSRD